MDSLSNFFSDVDSIEKQIVLLVIGALAWTIFYKLFGMGKPISFILSCIIFFIVGKFFGNVI